MAIDIPDELKPVAALVVTDWPKANEDSLRGQAEYWEQIGELLGQLRTQGDPVVKDLLSHTEGSTHDAVDAFWKRFGGDSGLLHSAEVLCKELAHVLRVMAWLVITVKLTIIALLVWLAFVIAQAVATAVPTLGASTAEAAAAEVSVRILIANALRKFMTEVMVETIIKQLTWKWVSINATLGATFGAGKEVAFQVAENQLGLRKGYSPEAIAHGAIHDAAVAPIARPLGEAAARQLISRPGLWGGTQRFGANVLLTGTITNKLSDPITGQHSISKRIESDATKLAHKWVADVLEVEPLQ